MDVEKLSPIERQVYEKLKDVLDPEIGLSIVEMGLVDEVSVEGGRVRIVYHLTAPFCPPFFAIHIGRSIHEKARKVEGIDEVEVRVRDHIQAEAINKALSEAS